jgi:hypothetical protein
LTKLCRKSHFPLEERNRLKLKRTACLTLIVISVGAGAPLSTAASKATQALQKLQSLAGDWAGKDQDGSDVKSSFKSIASNTAVMETLAMSGMDEMVTLYSIDGDTVILLHYCPTNNQPRMRATPVAGEVKKLEFTFEGAGNLPSLDTGHEHKLVIEFQDSDHIVEHWTWRKNGKDTETTFHLARKNKG